MDTNLSYWFLSSSPFEGGTMWVSTSSGTNAWHCFLYDIDQRQILGELLRGQPVFMNRDQSRLLCSRRGAPERPFRQKIAWFMQRISGGRIRLGGINEDSEVFWVLDLQRNVATRIGDLSQFRGGGSTFRPSPGFRFGFNKPTGSSQKPEFFVCDLEDKSFRKIAMDGFPAGWWSDTEIIVKSPANDFLLYDVQTEKRAPLLSSGKLAEFLAAEQIPDADPARANIFSIWNGRQYDLYLTDTHKKWLATNSYLIKLEQPGAALKLMAADFKFEWSDHLDPTGTRYVYTGRTAGDRTTGVFLRDPRDNVTRTLVAPDDSRYFSLPRFYRDGVIFKRDSKLWWIDFDGSNRTCVFPPPPPTQ